MREQLPEPGDMIVARHSMRAWASELAKLDDGHVVLVGSSGIVLAVRTAGNQVRTHVLIDGGVHMLSCHKDLFYTNWTHHSCTR